VPPFPGALCIIFPFNSGLMVSHAINGVINLNIDIIIMVPRINEKG